MRLLSASLALGGLPWLYFAFPFVLSPLGIFEAEYDYGSRDVAFSLFATPIAALGYFIWCGCAYRAIRDRDIVRAKIFWIVSGIVHCGWILLFAFGPLGGARNPEGSWLISYMWIWLIGNLALAIILGALETLEEKHA